MSIGCKLGCLGLRVREGEACPAGLRRGGWLGQVRLAINALLD